jgi:integral membrane protein (TIGR01906 family)
VKKSWSRIAYGLIVVTLPIVLLIADVRLMTGRWFVHWEYGKATFPPDPYGLTTAERITLAEPGVDYLAGNAEMSVLEELELPNGEPAFNQRELRHLYDVRVVYHRLMIACTIGAVILAGSITVLLTSEQTGGLVPDALLRGSMLTLTLLGMVGAYMALQWRTFFTAFHRLFFEGDTWLFEYSDTLIRCYPMRFWMDVAIVIVSLLASQAIIIGIAGWMWRRRLTTGA